MRTFEQRIAEIHRRSNQILQERKRRKKRILLACAPLALCVIIFSAFFTLEKLSSGADTANDSDMVMENVGAVPEQLGDRIEVSGTGIYLCYTDPDDILLITDHLQKCGVEIPKRSSPTANPGSESVVEDHSYSAAGDTNGSTTQYTLAITSAEGDITRYTFTGLLLENENTQKTYLLSQEQAKTLAELLNVPCP